MKAGNVYRVHKTKDGRQVTLRAPKWDDLDDFLEFINSLVEEGAEINMDQKQTRESEADWLARELVALEKGEKIYVTGEVGGKVVANSVVTRFSSTCQSHVGLLGIAVKDGYRNIGIGTEMIKVLIEESRKMGLKILILDVYGTNKRARHVYEKVGFKEAGKIPKGIFKDGKYIDSIRMALEL
jgi:RimJ/RimL family protein N-acetyltransferase